MAYDRGAARRCATPPRPGRDRSVQRFLLASDPGRESRARTSREVGVSAAPWSRRGLEHGNHPVRFSPPRTKSSGDLPVARRTVAHEQATGLLATKGGPFNERDFDEHELASGSSRVTRPVAWDRVTHADVLRAIRE